MAENPRLIPFKLQTFNPANIDRMIRLDEYTSHRLHVQLVRAYRQAVKANEALHNALAEASTARQLAYSALTLFETELALHEDKTGVKPGHPYITIDVPADDSEATE